MTAPTPALRRDAERNRRRILTAADAVFAERGLEASLDEIARRAEVGVGTVYRRFSTREALIDALFEDKLGEIVAMAEAAAALPDPWEGLVAWMTGITERQATDRGLKAVLASSVQGRERIEEARGRIIPVVTGVLDRAKAAGTVREDVELTDLPVLETMLSAAAERLAPIDPERWRRYLVLVLDGLRAGPGRPSPLPAPALEVKDFDALLRRG